MLKIDRYGILLRQVSFDDIEMVRQWRNDPQVSKYMAFRDHITPDMQQRWFEGVSARGDLYFIICVEGQEVGLINLKDINLEQGIAEAGIFLASTSLRNSDFPYRASFCLYDYAFSILKLNRVKAHILDNNKRAIRYNLSMGFKPTEEFEHGSNRLYYLEKKNYFEMSEKIKKVLQMDPEKHD